MDAGEARAVIVSQTYDGAGRRAVGRLHQPGADPPLVPARHRRPPPRRALPAGGQRRRDDHRVRAAPPLRRHLGVRRRHDLDRGAGDRRGRRPGPLRARALARVDAHWDEFGPGAVGIGWDLTVLGLALHVAAGGEPVDGEAVMAWTTSTEGLEFMTLSNEAWRDADIADGTDPEIAAAAADRTMAAYTAT